MAGFELNANAFMEGLGKAVVRMKVEGDVELDTLGVHIKEIARRNAPVGPDRDGRTHLRDTIFAKPGEELRGHYVDIGTTDPVGAYNEYGTRPHIIRVQTARVLTDGQTFFGTSVNHPGTTAKPWLEPAFLEGVATWRLIGGR